MVEWLYIDHFNTDVRGATFSDPLDGVVSFLSATWHYLYQVYKR